MSEETANYTTGLLGVPDVQWALPPGVTVPPAALRLRLDFYEDSILAHHYHQGVTRSRLVDPEDVARALTSKVPVTSGLLPPEALWWLNDRDGPVVALWRPPQKWRVALRTDPFAPAQRLHLPMPGLIFLCQPCRPPWVFAAHWRPSHPNDLVYQAPCFNLFRRGESCPGNHQYSDHVSAIPEEFFTAFFSPEGDEDGRSREYPDALAPLWESLEGQEEYPLEDLVPCGTVADLMRLPGGRREWDAGRFDE